MIPSSDDLTVAEVAARLRLKVRAVQRALREGRLRGYKVGPRCWRVTAEALEEYCAEPVKITNAARPRTPRQAQAAYRRAMADLAAMGL